MVHVQISRSNESFLCHTVFYRFKSEESTLAPVHPKLFWRVSTRLWSRVSCFFFALEKYGTNWGSWSHCMDSRLQDQGPLAANTGHFLNTSVHKMSETSDRPTHKACWLGWNSRFWCNGKTDSSSSFYGIIWIFGTSGGSLIFHSATCLPGWIDMAGDILAYVGNSGMMWEKVEASVFDNVAPLRVTGNCNSRRNVVLQGWTPNKNHKSLDVLDKLLDKH